MQLKRMFERSHDRGSDRRAPRPPHRADRASTRAARSARVTRRALHAREWVKSAVALAAFAVVSTFAGAPRSEVVGIDLGQTYYHEGTPYGHMNVYTPSSELAVKPADWLAFRGGWEADVVSGASIKTRNAQRGSNPDVISSASVRDFRQAVNGGFTLARKLTTLEGGYTYSWEHDYRSHSFDVSAKAELFQRSMELSIAYARNWDSVCDRLNPDPDPTRATSLGSSDKCFTADTTVTTHPIVIDALQGSWTQLWTPVVATQVTLSAQLMNGFLSNPYREVNIGVNTPVQEHEPANRQRFSLGVRVNYFLEAIKTALRLGVRGYRDTWDVRAVTTELEAERYVFIDALRLRLRGRYYTQSHAAFYSDDYLVQPRGQYWTGDRELSKMQSILAGLRIAYGPAATDKKVLGFLEKLEVSLGADLIFFRYSDFTINGEPLRKTAIVGSLGLTLLL